MAGIIGRKYWRGIYESVNTLFGKYLILVILV